MDEALDILAIGAHPDDVEMTSGGWLCLAAGQGYRTGVLHLSRGEMGTHGNPETRSKEAEAAAKVMGCSVIEFAGMADGKINESLESVQTVVAVLRRLQPRIVISPYPICHHPDHEAASKLVRKAVHFASMLGYEGEGGGEGGEPHRVTRLVRARYSHPFEPSFYVDISTVIEKKREAILCYASQFTDSIKATDKPRTRMAHEGFIDQFLASSAAMGLSCGCAYAEAYSMKAPPLFHDPVEILTGGPGQHLLR